MACCSAMYNNLSMAFLIISVLSPVTFHCWQPWRALTLPMWPKYCYNRWNQSQRWSMTDTVLCPGLTWRLDPVRQHPADVLREGLLDKMCIQNGILFKMCVLCREYGVIWDEERATSMNARPRWKLLLLPLGIQTHCHKGAA